MFDIDEIPDGPKTPPGVRRLINIVFVGVVVIVTGAALGVSVTESIGSFIIAAAPTIAVAMGIALLSLRYGPQMLKILDSITSP